MAEGAGSGSRGGNAASGTAAVAADPDLQPPTPHNFPDLHFARPSGDGGGAAASAGSGALRPRVSHRCCLLVRRCAIVLQTPTAVAFHRCGTCQTWWCVLPTGGEISAAPDGEAGGVGGADAEAPADVAVDIGALSER